MFRFVCGIAAPCGSGVVPSFVLPPVSFRCGLIRGDFAAELSRLLFSALFHAAERGRFRKIALPFETGKRVFRRLARRFRFAFAFSFADPLSVEFRRDHEHRLVIGTATGNFTVKKFAEFLFANGFSDRPARRPFSGIFREARFREGKTAYRK